LRREPSYLDVIEALEDQINRRRWEEIVFCGFGEPTERLDCLIKVSKWIKRYFRIPIRIDTNGQAFLLYPGRKIIKELKEAGITKVSVSLNAHDEETYIKVCRPMLNDAYKSVIKFIKASAKTFETEVTVVDVPQVNLAKVREIAESLGAKFRVRRYFFPAI